MARRSLVEAAEAMHGRLLGRAAAEHAGDGAADESDVRLDGGTFDGASLDSRRVRPGQLFFALPGETTDGHRFVADALERGAAAVVVQRDPAQLDLPADAPVIRVEDTYQALHDLTRHVRRTVPERLVAITGSAGKTTTKELLAALLARSFRVAKSPGNLNNLYGFPLTLLGTPEDSQWLVAEMGMSTPDELRRISLLGRPDVAVYTNVGTAHLERFGTVEALAEAKAEMLEGLVEGGLVIANADDPQVTRIVRRHLERDPRATVVWYGRGTGDADLPTPDFTVRGIESLSGRPGHRFLLVGPAGAGMPEAFRVAVELPLYGRHNLENFLAAAATAVTLGVAPRDVAAAATELQPASGRGELERLEGGVTLLDETYNSNPQALERALEGAAALDAGRRWAVLGDMLELGPEGPRFHRRAGRSAARHGFSPVAGVGELARELAAAAGEAGAETAWFATADEAAVWAPRQLAEGDLVLVKGSRGVGLEVVVDALRRKAVDGALRKGGC